MAKLNGVRSCHTRSVLHFLTDRSCIVLLILWPGWWWWTGGRPAALQSLRQAIEKTQSNVDLKVDEDTPYGHYIEAEMDGGVGRDVMEFLVKKDAGVVAYRCMATKVTFVYPFTTAVGDSKGQKQRIAAISQELGWYAPDIQSSIDSDDDAPP